MPIPKGARVRCKTTKSGKKIRLTFAPNSNKVIEVKRGCGRKKKKKMGN